MRKQQFFVSLSGGMDSAVVLSQIVGANCVPGEAIPGVETVGFTYGSKHNVYEQEAAKALARYYDVPYRLIDLTSIMEHFKSDLLKSGGEIPEGHYEHQSMSRTVVPGRNTIFTSILMGLAESAVNSGQCEKAVVVLGVHSGDHAIYPDCRPGFINAMSVAIEEATVGKVSLIAPMLYRDKTDIAAIGIHDWVPFELTRTCYKDQPIACGKCGSCQERLEAFANAHTRQDAAGGFTRRLKSYVDPIHYESRTILPK